MTIDSTAAKIGRSMKKCAITAVTPRKKILRIEDRGSRIEDRCLRSSILDPRSSIFVLAGRRGLRLAGFGRWFPRGGLGERRHGHRLRLDLHARPDLLQPADDHP